MDCTLQSSPVALACERSTPDHLHPARLGSRSSVRVCVNGRVYGAVNNSVRRGDETSTRGLKYGALLLRPPPVPACEDEAGAALTTCGDA